MAGPVAICRTDELVDAGSGIRFEVEWRGERLAAFLISYRGEARAYLNRCAHRGVELDWEPGTFFDADGKWLVCATHGALYDPLTGACIAGPCRGASLQALPIVRSGELIGLIPNDELHFVHRI